MAWRMNVAALSEKLDHTPLIIAPKSVVQTEAAGSRTPVG